MADLTTRYLGFDLPHPFVPGAGPLCDELDTVRRLEDAGAPMLTLRSLFEEQIVGEQINHLHVVEEPAEAFAEARSYLPQPPELRFGPYEYLDHLHRVREAVSIPVVGSLNGHTEGGWLEYAQFIEQAGADAIELNIYDLPTNPKRNGSTIEDETVRMVEHIKASVSVPVAVKLSPFYTSMPDFVARLDATGVDAIVLFNRFYQPDVDIEALETIPSLQLSDSSELLLRLRWLAILSGQVRADLAATGGVHTPTDAVKAIMCGAQVVQVVSVLLKHGVSQLRHLRDAFAAWLDEHEYSSIDQMRGNMNLSRCPDPASFERVNYMRILQSWRG